MQSRIATVISLIVALSGCQSLAPDDAPSDRVISAEAPTPSVQTGRYTAVVTLPTVAQRDPLAAIVQIPRLPSDIRTVEQGMRYVLSRTGYSLAATDEHTDAAIQTLYQLPIPEVQRALGPMSVHDCLAVFAGQAFRLRVDRVARVVTVTEREG